MDAGRRSITDFFNQGRTLEIPFFQRSYVWSDENWERFLSDIEIVSTENRSYFMGSIILKTRPVPSGNAIGDWRIVVDGQQRLTTIVVFCKALCEVQKNNEELFDRIFYNRKKEIILRHNHSDIEVFEAIVKDRLTSDLEEKYKSSSILECYRYFKNRKKELAAIDFNRFLDRLYFLGIDLGVEEDEQQIFDTINSLGVSLTTAELLKNELFRREDEALYEKTWKSTFEIDEDSKSYWDLEVTSGRQHRINIDLFLQSYLLIKSEAHDKYLGLSSLFANYTTFIKDNKIKKPQFVETLVEYAKPYRDNIDPDLLNQEIDQKSYIERLNVVVFGLNTTTVVPYILYILKEVKRAEERAKIFHLLESYLMRRLICKGTTKNYNNLFATFIRNKINSVELLKNKIDELKDVTNYFPTDKVLIKSVQESNKLTNQQAKTALYLIEKSIQNSKDATVARPFNEYSVEHVMPKKWRNHWTNLGSRDAGERDQGLLNLGNLTLLTSSLNSSIRDAAWNIKKSGRNGKKGLEEYSTGIKTFQLYLKEADWNEETIFRRGEQLSKYAVDIWKI